MAEFYFLLVSAPLLCRLSLGADFSYVPQMNGVLLAHWDHSIPDDTVKIINECPFGVCEVQFCAIVWAPRVGQVLCE